MLHCVFVRGGVASWNIIDTINARARCRNNFQTLEGHQDHLHAKNDFAVVMMKSQNFAVVMMKSQNWIFEAIWGFEEVEVGNENVTSWGET